MDFHVGWFCSFLDIKGKDPLSNFEKKSSSSQQQRSNLNMKKFIFCEFLLNSVYF